ncbi:MAG: HEPN domain-containing protein, partial [Lachnospiraceae bacterium]|nr:HEPN domain-containing protein [Lachnospiraceae bacterium]
MDDQRIALSHYLMDKAYHCLLAAKGNVRDEEYTSAANRSYYAIFHSMRGILALDGVDYRKHSQVIGHFRREYIKTQIFDVKYSDVIGEAFAVRGDSDYEDFY